MDNLNHNLDSNRKLILQKVIDEVDNLNNLEPAFRVELVGKIMILISQDDNRQNLQKDLDELLNEARVRNEINFVNPN